MAWRTLLRIIRRGEMCENIMISSSHDFKFLIRNSWVSNVKHRFPMYFPIFFKFWQLKKSPFLFQLRWIPFGHLAKYLQLLTAFGTLVGHRSKTWFLPTNTYLTPACGNSTGLHDLECSHLDDACATGSGQGELSHWTLIWPSKQKCKKDGGFYLEP